MMQDSARRIARVSVESKMDLDEENYVESFRPHLMDVVHAWSSVRIIVFICTVLEVVLITVGVSLLRREHHSLISAK